MREREREREGGGRGKIKANVNVIKQSKVWLTGGQSLIVFRMRQIVRER